MIESVPGNAPEGPSDEDIEMYAAYMAEHPDVVVPEDQRSTSEKEIAEFESLIAAFEGKHDLAALHAITRIRSGEEDNYPERDAAKNDLIPIVDILNKLEKETDVTKERWNDLKEQYKKLSRAVGIINGGTVYHDR